MFPLLHYIPFCFTVSTKHTSKWNYLRGGVANCRQSSSQRREARKGGTPQQLPAYKYQMQGRWWLSAMNVAMNISESMGKKRLKILGIKTKHVATYGSLIAKLIAICNRRVNFRLLPAASISIYNFDFGPSMLAIQTKCKSVFCEMGQHSNAATSLYHGGQQCRAMTKLYTY